MIENIKEIGIVDIRNIIKKIRDTYNYDFTNYSLTSFKFKTEKFIHSLNEITVDFFIRKLTKDQIFFDSFLHAISTGTPSMFQDPSVWHYLKEKLIPENCRNVSPYNIWLPFCVNGNELFSMCILLQESDLQKNINLFASYLSEKSLQQIKSGEYVDKTIEYSEHNYVRFNPGKSLQKYTRSANEKQILDASLISKVIFDKQDILLTKVSNKMNLIIFRNQTLNYNNTLKDKIIENIYNTLHPEGILILGDKENLKNCRAEKYFKLISESESIYKKKA